MRTKEELAELAEKLIEHCSADVSCALEAATVSPALKELVQERLKKFFVKRIGHLPDADFLNFTKLLLDGKKTTV